MALPSHAEKLEFNSEMSEAEMQSGSGPNDS